jgi:hypothetical protein
MSDRKLALQPWSTSKLVADSSMCVQQMLALQMHAVQRDPAHLKLCPQPTKHART